MIFPRGSFGPLSRAACAPGLFNLTVGRGVMPPRATIFPCEEFRHGQSYPWVSCPPAGYPRTCGIFSHTSGISVWFSEGGGGGWEGQKHKKRRVTADGRRSVQGGDTVISWCTYSCRHWEKEECHKKKMVAVATVGAGPGDLRRCTTYHVPGTTARCMPGLLQSAQSSSWSATSY